MRPALAVSGLMAILSILGPAAAGTASSAPTGPRARLGTIRFTTVPVATMGPYFVALEKGYFEEQGVEIKEMVSRSSAARLQATMAGSMDIATSGFGADIVSAIQQGAPVRIVLSLGREREGFAYTWFVIRKDLWDSGVRDFKDLRGRKLAAGGARGSIGEMMLRFALSHGGLTITDVIFVVVNHPQVPDALAGKAIDAAYVAEPFAQAAVDRGHARKLRTAVSAFPGGMLDTAVLLMHTGFMREKPELGRAFIRAWLKGAEFANAAIRTGTHREEFHRIVAKYTKLPLEMVARIGYPEAPPDGRLTEAAVLRITEFFFEEKQIPRKATSVGEIADYGLLP